MAKAGRPKNTIETKRIQYVIPKAVLDKLDSKVRKLKEKDRSKAITVAVSEWLGLNKKKRKSENIYSKLMGVSDTTFNNELFLKTEYKDDVNIVKIVEEFFGLLIRGKEIPEDRLTEFNDLLKNNNFYIDDSFRLNCDSNKLINFVFLLLLNVRFPVNNYFGICQYCNKEFIKKRAGQKFCSPSCQIKHYYEKKKNTKDPKEYKELSESIKRIKRKNQDYVISFSDYNDEDEIKRYKNIISTCCTLAGSKYKKFKKIWQENIVGNSFQKIRSVLILMNEIYLLILKKPLKEIEELTLDSFLSWGIDEFFPISCGKSIKRNVALLLKKYITIERFNVEKKLCIGYKKLELTSKSDNAEYLNYYYQSLVEYSEYFTNKFDEDYKKIIKDPNSFEIQKNTNIQCSVLRIAYVKLSAGFTDECIEICKGVLKYNCLCIDAHCTLIIAYGNKQNSKKMIYHYRCIERIMLRLQLLNGGKITNVKRLKKEMLAIRRISDFGYVKGYAAFAYMIEGNNKKALEILKPKVFFISEVSKQLRESTLFSVYLRSNNFVQARKCLNKLKNMGINTEKLETFLKENVNKK